MTTKDQRNVAAKKQFQCQLCAAFKRVLRQHGVSTPQGEFEPEVFMVDTSIKWDVPPHRGEVVGICRGCSQLLAGWTNYQATVAQHTGKLSKIIVPGPGVIK